MLPQARIQGFIVILAHLEHRPQQLHRHPLAAPGDQRPQGGRGAALRLEPLPDQVGEGVQVTGPGGVIEQTDGGSGSLLWWSPADEIPAHGGVLQVGIPQHLTGQGERRVVHLVQRPVQHHLHPLEIPGVHRPFAGIQPDVLRVG